MGSKMESKYDGKCEKCGTTWLKGKAIFYQKGDGTEANPKLVCSDETCFKENGGIISEFKPNFQKGQTSFQSKPVKNIEQKLADIDIAYAHALSMLKDFQSKVGSISPSESAIFIESMTRTTIQV